jgi:hypothetical protein
MLFLIYNWKLKTCHHRHLFFIWVVYNPLLFENVNISLIDYMIFDMQEDVLERAKRAKEKAAREALEAQGLISKPTTAQTTPATDSVNSVTPPSVTSEITAVNPSSSSVPTTPLARPDIDPAEL